MMALRELPQGYTALDYLSNNNSANAVTMAYINSGVSASQIGYISTQLMYTGNPKDRPLGDGAVQNTGTQFYMILGIVPNSNRAYYGAQFGGGGSERRFSTSFTSGTWHTIAIDVLNGKAYCDNEQISLTIGTPQNKPVFFFIRSLNGGEYNDARYCWGSSRRRIKIIDRSGIVLRDFIPALNPEGAAGMYDKANGVFYTSPNGTKFDQDTR